MKPATDAELRSAIERECMNIQEDCFMMCAIPLLHVVNSVWARMDVNLRTGGDIIIK